MAACTGSWLTPAEETASDSQVSLRRTHSSRESVTCSPVPGTGPQTCVRDCVSAPHQGLRGPEAAVAEQFCAVSQPPPGTRDRDCPAPTLLSQT